MAKTIEFDLYRDGVLQERMTRPQTKMGVCIDGKFYDVKDGRVDINEMDDYPWDPIPLDPELERLLTNFITKREEMIEKFNLIDLYYREEPTPGLVVRRRKTFQQRGDGGFLAAAMIAAGYGAAMR